MSAKFILSIDQGTTSSRALIYDATAKVLGTSQQEFTQHYPRPGWVEHDAEEIWQSVAAVVAGAIRESGIDPKEIAAIGLTNQRETAVAWDRASGQPLGRAIVWQDRRTADFCRDHAGDRDFLHSRTGLILDPYFSATKWRWMRQNKHWDTRRVDPQSIAFGTVDSYLIARLSGNQRHVTDVTNASRTLLFDLHARRWDDELCKYFDIPISALPEVLPSAADFGVTQGLDFLPDGLPITGVAGDQQAALFGQCAISPGEAKCTYGTGAFFLVHVGDKPVLSRHKLVTTLAAMTSEQPEYALEGSVFVAGAAVQWLRDGLKLFRDAAESEALASTSDPEQPLLFVPGFVGLGAPHWEPDARGALLGLTRNTTAADLARAALEGVAFQVVDLIDAAKPDQPAPLGELRADGGMARNDRFLQAQADLLGIPVVRVEQSESTALGAALLAGLHVGIWKSRDAIRGLVREAKRFEPVLAEAERKHRVERWRAAVRAVVSFAHER